MIDPFAFDGPAVVSFSGGRTSAYMLWRIRQAHGGRLPPDIHVVFANTGKERPETLDFVRDVSERWKIHVRWIEWHLIHTLQLTQPPPRWIQQIDARRQGKACVYHSPFTPVHLETFREVSYDTASRAGEPFERLIQWKRFLPNPVTRLCTQHLKVYAMRFFITTSDVMAFWSVQPFDLRLRSDEGNCDLCFMKGTKKLVNLIQRRPDLAPWWVTQEAHTGAAWRSYDRPTYAQLTNKRHAQLSLPIALDDEDALPCACTD